MNYSVDVVSPRGRGDQGVPAAAELHAWVFRCKVHKQEIVIYRVHLLTHLNEFLLGHIQISFGVQFLDLSVLV